MKFFKKIKFQVQYEIEYERKLDEKIKRLKKIRDKEQKKLDRITTVTK